MSKMIFINLPVTDLARSTAFYEAVGATKNPQFSNDATGNCMVLSETIHVMLLTHAFYKTFTTKEIADAHRTSAVLLCLSADSRDAVDAMVEKALVGGKVDPCPKQDHGFMYGRSFEDPDGHIWEVMWMDVAAMQAASAKAA